MMQTVRNGKCSLIEIKHSGTYFKKKKIIDSFSSPTQSNHLFTHGKDGIPFNHYVNLCSYSHVPQALIFDFRIDLFVSDRNPRVFYLEWPLVVCITDAKSSTISNIFL